jgi:DNA-binding response OmpR family regulator
LRALVASEDRAERALIRDALAARAEVSAIEVVRDGIEAYIAIRREAPDLAVLSVTLSRIDGLVLVRLPRLRARRTILVLGADSGDRVREVLRARPSGIIVRPFDAATLRERVAAVLTMPEPVPLQTDADRPHILT